MTVIDQVHTDMKSAMKAGAKQRAGALRLVLSELDDAELDVIVAAAIADTGASEQKDMGRVMKAVMANAGGRADGKRASARVREALGA